MKKMLKGYVYLNRCKSIKNSNTELYYLMTRIFCKKFKGLKEIKAIYLRHGMLDNLYPGDSDIDFTIIIKNLDEIQEKRFAIKFFKKYEKLRKIFPFFSDNSEISFIKEKDVKNKESFKMLRNIFDDGYSSNIKEWKLLYGADLINRNYSFSFPELNYPLSKWFFYLQRNIYQDFPDNGKKYKIFNKYFLRSYHKFIIRTLKFCYRINHKDDKFLSYFKEKYPFSRNLIQKLERLEQNNYFSHNFKNIAIESLYVLNKLLSLETENKLSSSLIKEKFKDNDYLEIYHKYFPYCKVLFHPDISFDDFRKITEKKIGEFSKDKKMISGEFIFYPLYLFGQKHLLSKTDNIMDLFFHRKELVLDGKEDKKYLPSKEKINQIVRTQIFEFEIFLKLPLIYEVHKKVNRSKADIIPQLFAFKLFLDKNIIVKDKQDLIDKFNKYYPNKKEINIFLRYVDGMPSKSIDQLHLLNDFFLLNNKDQKKIKKEETIDSKTLHKKILCGYQGWFNCEGDGTNKGWANWCKKDKDFSKNTLAFEMWPDMRGYSEEEKYIVDGFTHSDGKPAYLFSSANPRTVLRHFEWMKDYKIDGVLHQRFITHFQNEKPTYDVLNNIRKAAKKTGRVYALTYDLSDTPSEKIYDLVIKDWRFLVDKMKITSDSNYLHHNGKPVLSIFGFYSNRFKPEIANKLIDFFRNNKQYEVTLIGVCEWNWLSEKNKEWAKVFRRFDVISPWKVGLEKITRFIGKKNIHSELWKKELKEAKKNNMSFMPVVYPGFSWKNLKNNPLSLIMPRNKGKFYQQQFKTISKLKIDMVYVAMFDEVNEGTAIFKVTNNPPTQGNFLTYENMPTDKYLKITEEASNIIKGKGMI